MYLLQHDSRKCDGYLNIMYNVIVNNIYNYYFAIFFLCRHPKKQNLEAWQAINAQQKPADCKSATALIPILSSGKDSLKCDNIYTITSYLSTNLSLSFII